MRTLQNDANLAAQECHLDSGAGPDGTHERGGLGGEEQAPAIILRFDDLPATPDNVERIRHRVHLLNLLLAASGTPFRLRVA